MFSRLSLDWYLKGREAGGLRFCRSIYLGKASIGAVLCDHFPSHADARGEGGVGEANNPWFPYNEVQSLQRKHMSHS